MGMLSGLKTRKRFPNLVTAGKAFGKPSERTVEDALGDYVLKRPSDQNALDIFKGEWACSMPSTRQSLAAGTVPAFEDSRVTWFLSQVGVQGKKVLELGPLEAGHTYMLENAGAESIVAIEANTRAYLKCLIVKEILGLRRARFHLGDFMEYLGSCSDSFDVCFASGILYHMHNPAELIARVAAVSSAICIWSHYYDENLIRGNSPLGKTFTKTVEVDCRGFKHRLHRHEYAQVVGGPSFWGGGAQYSMWMTREDMLACLRHFGFTDIRTAAEEPFHTGGPAFCVVAVNQRGRQ